jgi:hypothetical protein
VKNSFSGGVSEGNRSFMLSETHFVVAMAAGSRSGRDG